MYQQVKQRIAQAKAEKWKHLDLGNCRLTNLAAQVPELFTLTDLTLLNLSGNQLTNVSGLSGLSTLVTLNLNSNQLTDISPLSGLTALTTLGLGNNQLIDVSPLSGLAALKVLNLMSNKLTNISGLSNLSALTELHLHNNVKYKENYWSFQNPDNGYIALRLQNGDIVRGCICCNKDKFIEAVIEKYGNLHPYIAWANRKD